MRSSVTKIVLPVLLLLSGSAAANTLSLTSSDIAQGKFMNNAQAFNGFGCSGANVSPQLSWSGAPQDTEAYAIFAYDPDAPTGSGWWHWQMINIPKEITTLVSGAGDSNNAPIGSLSTKNDYGTTGYGGACPPEGDGPHRYQFTIFALSKKIDLPKDASAAVVGYMVHANTLASTTLEALYKRN